MNQSMIVKRKSRKKIKKIKGLGRTTVFASYVTSKVLSGISAKE